MKDYICASKTLGGTTITVSPISASSASVALMLFIGREARRMHECGYRGEVSFKFVAVGAKIGVEDNDERTFTPVMGEINGKTDS